MRTRFIPVIALVCVAVVSAVAPAQAESNIVVEPNLQVFTVLAAVNAAGYNDGANRPDLAPMRAAVRKELAARHIPSLPALKDYYERHRLQNPAHDLGQYISLALFLGPPPSFKLQGTPNALPPEAGDLASMIPLIVSFYQEAGVAAMWKKYQPAMEMEAGRYRKFLSQVMLETTGYLRMDASNHYNRKFALYISPLSAPGQINARSYGENYYIVVGPSAKLPQDDIRHGWLHYLLDPLAWKYSRDVASKAQLEPLAQRAPALDASFKSNFSLLVTESLVRAIQAWRLKGSPQQKQRAADNAVEEGYILTDYFFEALPKFEKQPVGMELYYPDLIDGIRVKTEEKRLAKVQFRRPANPETYEALWPSAEQMIRQGEDYIARRQYSEARQVLETVNRQRGPQPRALYDLAIVATQEKQPQVAKQYFTQAAAQASDPHIKAWSHIYLGRLLDLEGNRNDARAQYSAALAAGDRSAKTRAAAQKGLQQGFSPARGASGSAWEEVKKPRQGTPMGKD